MIALLYGVAWAAWPDRYEWTALSGPPEDFVDWRQVEEACAIVERCTDSEALQIQAFCAGKLDDLPTKEELEQAACDSNTLGGARTAAFSSPLAGFDATSVLFGLTDFLLDRAEREVRAYVLAQAGRELCPEDVSWFPATCALLQDDEVSILLSGLTLLREAVESDLQGLPRRIALIELDRSGSKDTDPLVMLAVAGRSAELVQRGASPLAALGGWAASRPQGLTCEQTPAAMGAYVLSVALASAPVAGGEIVLPEAEGSRFWAGAVAINLKTRGQEPVPCDLPVLSALAELPTRAHEIETHQEQLEQALARLRTDPTSPGAHQAVLAAHAALTADGVRLLELALSWQRSPSPGEIVYVRRLLEAMGRQDWAAVLLRSVELVEELGQSSDELVRFSTLASALLAAQDADSARQAIDAWAAPMGAFLRKRRGEGLYAQLQGYVGLEVGASRALPGEDVFVAGAAPFLPVGIEVGGRAAQGPTVGVLLSVLDVGQLAAWRLQSSADDVKSEPEVRLAEVFAPGLWVPLGLREAPLSFGFGAGVTPASLVRDDAAPLDAVRVGGFLAVDIPLFP